MGILRRSTFIRLIALLCILGGVGYYLFLHPEMLVVIGQVKIKYIFIMVAVDSLFFLSLAMILKLLLESFALNLSFRECLAVSSLAGIGNFLASLRGGTIGKAVYLKKRHDFSYMMFIAATSATELINLGLAALMGAAAILIIGYNNHSLFILLFCFFIFVDTLLCLLLFFPTRLVIRRWKIFTVLSDIVKGLDSIRRDRRLLMKISFFLLVNFLLNIIELTFSYRAFLIDITISQVILIEVVSLFSGIIKIVPGNLGIYEGSIALSSELLGIGLEEGFLAAGLVRIVSVFVTLMFGSIFGLRLFKECGSAGIFQSKKMPLKGQSGC